MTGDDLELVSRCRSGDDRAVRELVERFQGEVFGLCVRMLGCRHDAEDCTQEVFVRVCKSLHRWDGLRPLRPWVLGIAVNRCRTALAKRPRRPELVDHLHESVAGPEPDDSVELTRELALGLAELRDDYRSAFVLYHDQGRSYDEIAQVFRRPVGTIKTWLHRARAELLAYLRQRGLVDVPDETSHAPLRRTPE